MPNPIEANADNSQKPRDLFSKVFGSSGLGVGFVLVFLPAAVLMLGLGLAAGSLVVSATLALGQGYRPFIVLCAVTALAGAVLFSTIGRRKGQR